MPVNVSRTSRASTSVRFALAFRSQVRMTPRASGITAIQDSKDIPILRSSADNKAPTALLKNKGGRKISVVVDKKGSPPTPALSSSPLPSKCVLLPSTPVRPPSPKTPMPLEPAAELTPRTPMPGGSPNSVFVLIPITPTFVLSPATPAPPPVARPITPRPPFVLSVAPNTPIQVVLSPYQANEVDVPAVSNTVVPGQRRSSAVHSGLSQFRS